MPKINVMYELEPIYLNDETPDYKLKITNDKGKNVKVSDKVFDLMLGSAKTRHDLAFHGKATVIGGNPDAHDYTLLARHLSDFLYLQQIGGTGDADRYPRGNDNQIALFGHAFGLRDTAAGLKEVVDRSRLFDA